MIKLTSPIFLISILISISGLTSCAYIARINAEQQARVEAFRKKSPYVRVIASNPYYMDLGATYLNAAGFIPVYSGEAAILLITVNPFVPTDNLCDDTMDDYRATAWISLQELSTGQTIKSSSGDAYIEHSYNNLSKSDVAVLNALDSFFYFYLSKKP